jgi:thiamine biosynthesis protein ThiI
LLYRRLMIRIGERAARMIRCHGLISGDSIAQVASQTLLNLEAVGAAATMPLYRPLCGDDKQEIVRISREIGCYEISNEPFTDCCPRYMPRNPRIFSSIEELDAAETKLEVDAMVEHALREMVRENYEYRRGEVRLKSVRAPRGASEEEAHAVALS